MKDLVFDFDGTLVDSMPTWGGKMLRILNEAGVSYPENIIEIITPLGDLGAARYFMEHLGVKESEESLLSKMDAYALPKYRDEILAKEGVREALSELRRRGHRLFVLTASPHRMLDPCLERLGLAPLFEGVFSCDDFATTKANPEIYDRLCERIGSQKEDLVFFDDNLGACKTAVSAGVRAVGVYDPSGEKFTEALKRLCGDYVYTLAEVSSLIL
jgi:HAD superfamily hydrolase (TIGR01509 family)